MFRMTSPGPFGSVPQLENLDFEPIDAPPRFLFGFSLGFRFGQRLIDSAATRSNSVAQHVHSVTVNPDCESIE